jgi:hypothetical protein
MPSQTGRPGTAQSKEPLGVPYVTPELIPQGVQPALSLRGAPMLVQFTNPQQPLYGNGLTSRTLPSSGELWPGQGPLDRGY